MGSIRRRVGAYIGGFGGGFEAGMGNRRLRNFLSTKTHVNSLISQSGGDIAARARSLVRNNGYARQAVESWAANAVGSGISPSPLVDQPEAKERIKALFQAWTDESDAEGITDFYGQQRRAAREYMAPGEVFFRFRPRRPSDGLTVPIQLQMIPSEQLSLTKNEVAANGNRIRQGIEYDRIGRKVAYHFWRNHPGDWTEGDAVLQETTPVPAADVIHMFDPFEGGQRRGVSVFSAAIVKLFSLDVYDDAELARKNTVALSGFALKQATPEAWEGPPTDPVTGLPLDRAEVNLEPGQITLLDPGEDMVSIGQADLGQSYEPFQYRTLLQISAALGIPYAYLSGDMVKANYSNSRLALLEFRRRVEAWQDSVMIAQFCRPVWVRWMDTAVLSGALVLPDYEPRRAEYLACDWLGDPWGWMDPQKDVRGQLEEVAGGLTSRRRLVAARGYDIETIDRERAQDLKREIDLNLVQTMPASEPVTPDTGQQQNAA